MINNQGLSLIIPTWKRTKVLKKIVCNLLRQNFPKNLYEIIIVNSYPKININLKKNKLIRIFNIKENSNAQKRNLGLKKSKFENIIFLDDDCIPEKNFLFKYHNLFKKINYKTVVCGSVLYDEKKFNRLKYLQYRQQTHFVVKNNIFIDQNKIGPGNIVTMNMGLKKKLNNGKIFFDKKFKNYGFEDYEFCYRYIKKGYNFYKANPIVIHMDNRNFSEYLEKFYFIGNKGSKIFELINKKAFKTTNYYFLENICIFAKFSGFRIFFYLLNQFCKQINNFFSYKFYFLIKINMSISYLLGYSDRINKKKYFSNWYK